MLGGYKGKLLHVDLTTEKVNVINLPEELMRKYIGGRGLGASSFGI